MTAQDTTPGPGSDQVSNPSPDSAALAEGAAGWSAAYVHLPFCARVCPYCDFAVVAGRDDMMTRYVGAVGQEIVREHPWRQLDSIYVGGGTPSRIEPGLLRGLITTLADTLGLAAGAEVSLEANPEDWTPKRARELIRAGFNRVSLGAQSFHPLILEALGRRHLPDAIARAVAVARQAGFSSINLDLIYGTPGESLADWEATLAAALEATPDHLSCYALTVEKGTPLHRQVMAGSPTPDPDVQADQYELAQEMLSADGLVQYEVSNWARPGHACRYNLAVWAQAEYLAFGMGAHRFRAGIRSHNLSRLDPYLEAIERGHSPSRGAEPVEGWRAEVERVFLGLRRRAGVMAGMAGGALITSEDGRRLMEAGVLAKSGDRLVIRQPLLTDTVLRVLLALSPTDC
ncbi:MAG TPA: radical SAM family heme chaperone HemW [Acidimicrobiia bacterium]|nr:radical SAM family heme chaperone HemW [Acidimicrobiia bacterium]